MTFHTFIVFMFHGVQLIVFYIKYVCFFFGLERSKSRRNILKKLAKTKSEN